MIDIYFRDIRVPLPCGIEKELPQSRVERAMKYKSEDGRNRCLYAGMLLSEYLNVHSDEDIIYNAYGKPFLKNGSLHFNLSHSGDYVVLAVSDYPVGVDIERIREYDRKVAQKCFTKDERDYLLDNVRDVLQNDEIKSFFRLWTAKEAVMKTDGRGFNMNPADFSVLPVKNGKHYTADNVYCLSWSEYNEHIVCAALQGKEDIVDWPNAILDH